MIREKYHQWQNMLAVKYDIYSTTTLNGIVLNRNKVTFWSWRGVPFTASSALMGTLSGWVGSVASVCNKPTLSSSASPSPIIPPMNRKSNTHCQYLFIFALKDEKRKIYHLFDNEVDECLVNFNNVTLKLEQRIAWLPN